MAAFGGLCFECYDLLLSTMNSVFSLENVLKNVFKDLSRKNWRSKTLLKLNFKLLSKSKHGGFYRKGPTVRRRLDRLPRTGQTCGGFLDFMHFFIAHQGTTIT